MTTAQESQDALLARTQARLGEAPSATWLAEVASDADACLAALPGTSQQIPRKSLVASFKDRALAQLQTCDGPLAVGEWRLDEAARVLLLARAASASEQPYQALFQAYDRGDTETRVAALRALALVSGGDTTQGVEMVLDAGRTNDPQLTAAAWYNPFSGKHLSDHDYRKAVLKAFFTGVAVEGFPRLLERADAELAQSLCEFIDERLAAGRQVTPAIWAVAALHPRPGLVARLLGNLEHPNPDERRAAALALQNARDPRASSFLAERLEREDDAGVREALTQAQTAIEQEGGR